MLSLKKFQWLGRRSRRHRFPEEISFMVFMAMGRPNHDIRLSVVGQHGCTLLIEE